ncbi:MAG: hypothetical protein V1770_06190 [bacterium]
MKRTGTKGQGIEEDLKLPIAESAFRDGLSANKIKERDFNPSLHNCLA